MLQKQPIAINFTQGLDLKSDPYQVPIGSFLNLNNSIFTTTGRLTKRNGFGKITTLPNTTQTTLTTLNDNLIATGSDLYSFNEQTSQWVNKGLVQPVNLSVSSLVRSSTAQSAVDAAVSPAGLVCTVYRDSSLPYYQISDSLTNEQIVARTALPATARTVRVFLLASYFIITFVATVGGQPHLQYLAIPIARPMSPGTATDISTVVTSLTTGYDAYVANNTMFIAWSSTATITLLTYITSTLSAASPITITGSQADLVSVTVDSTTAAVWVVFWTQGTGDAFVNCYDFQLNQVLPTGLEPVFSSMQISHLTSFAINGLCNIFYEVINSYVSPYPVANTRSDYVAGNVIEQFTGNGSSFSVARSIGMASKPFLADGSIYFLATYGSTDSTTKSNQPSYFIINQIGQVIAKIAYSNGGGYIGSQVLPSVSSINSSFYIPYQITDFLTTVNKGTALPSGTPSNAIYTQTGLNLLQFTINDSGQYSSEIAGALNLTGGQVWEYDGVKPVELGFQYYPENVASTTSTSGGTIGAGTYYYQFTYEWTDNQGNLHRSAPSIPIVVTTTGSTSSNTIYVPTLRLTYKTDPNPVRIVGYRWSVNQQVYYQFTSVTSPVLNNTGTDYVTITDTLPDSSILGNAILYTTGGVIEDIAPPASIDSALFNNRLFLIDAEDRNLLWFSKQVIESTPVEMSDLLTIYVAPTTGAQGSTGFMTALSAMDDKLIIFKKDAIYYINGIGPDNTGANSQFSDPVFITSAIGSANPSSIALIPNGLMFQSDKGIWMLGRDLSTQYIGAPVEAYNEFTVNSTQVIPGTNQVRFILNNNVTLMYDYFFNKWSTFNNVYAISGTLYQGLQTYLNKFGNIFQETPGKYLDDSAPVLMSFTTSWISLAGLQGYERFYSANLLGTYITPFKLDFQLAYDYNSSATQQVVISPDNFEPNWGGQPLWGSGGNWGGPGNVFSARVFPMKQKCETFQVSITEIYDPSYGLAAGEGLSLSGLALTVGVKRGTRTQSAAKSFG